MRLLEKVDCARILIQRSVMNEAAGNNGFAAALQRRFVSRASQAALRTLSYMDRQLHDSSLYGITLANPYKALSEVQARGRVLRSWAYQGWLVTGFEEVQQLMRSENMSNDLRSSKFMVRLVKSAVGSGRVPTIDNPSMLNQDPPDHTRLRRLVNEGFTHKFVQSLEPRIEAICTKLLDDVGSREFDVVQALAKPLPAIVIAEMLGVPERDYEQFQRCSADLLAITRFDSPELMRRAGVATEEMDDYFAGLAQEKRDNPGDDLISELVRLESEEDRLTLPELYSLCILILVAGHETTTRLIGTGLMLLLKHPAQLAVLREDLSLLPNAIEEMLRYEPPLQFTPRLVKKSFDFKGHQLQTGQATLLSIAAANRDPLANDDPHTFNILREEVRHVTFGYGPHLCLGMSLARLEARVVFSALLERFETMSWMDREPDWRREFFFRGVNSLNVRV